MLIERFGGTMMKKSPYGPGLAAAQVLVDDAGTYRRVRLVALAASFRQAAAGARTGQNLRTAARENPKIQASRKLVVAIAEALAAHDRGMRQIG